MQPGLNARPKKGFHVVPRLSLAGRLNIETRDARPSDKEPLMDFIRNVWGGHDYIPYVWDSWIRDRAAKLFVVEVDGKPVGMSRMRILPDGMAWLEGARVHPDYRRRGLASLLARHSMEVGKRAGIKAYRLSSSSYNRAAHAQVKKMGFREVTRISVYESPSKANYSPLKSVWRADKMESQKVQPVVERSPEYRLGAGVYWDDFSAVSLTARIIDGLIREESVFLTEGGVAVARIGGEGGEIWRQVCFVTGTPEATVRLVEHVFGTRERARAHRRLIYLPQGSRVIREMRELGLKRTWPLVLFEKIA